MTTYRRLEEWMLAHRVLTAGSMVVLIVLGESAIAGTWKPYGWPYNVVGAVFLSAFTVTGFRRRAGSDPS